MTTRCTYDRLGELPKNDFPSIAQHEAGVASFSFPAYPAMSDASGTDAFGELRVIMPEWSGKVSYGSEGCIFEVEGRIPAVIVGPGSIKQAHKADEFVEIGQIDACLRFLDSLLDEIADQKDWNFCLLEQAVAGLHCSKWPV
ncbi:M20/M25/M40 family metallo-hydrolase [Roseovarius sp. EGI FJ00037]|uniref:M20/M25/M40 family metallo-hydrolase n=1 Tax=Roseovarius salincola TaxID=2978479 RepID=UPI0022A89283|nr:M20/M25/M40 family metallo-hydrolase [Roseovarius sp. EGI FJ00037]MCZ0813761.1 M20/M25/M40 family metallo-hydrolase [Roseovarius sp. EGI FJ00037]